MGGARFVFCGKVWLDMIAMLLAWLAALLVLLAGFSLVTVAVFSVYLLIAHRRLPSPKGAS